jgi:TonB-linked SusC/RagA family outer membrane protein
MLLAVMFIFVNQKMAIAADKVTWQQPAQARRITGTVLDSANNPLQGATVAVRGTTRSTITNAEGNFSIDASTGEVLEISSVEYETRQITIGESSTLSITMSTSVITGQEVVVIGYQTVRRRDLTGAVSIVDPSQLTRNVSSSVAESMQGLAAGVTVRNTGEPGVAARIDIRGAGTFAGNNPLYIIDGMYSDATPDFNPNDIESIQVLKDASAAAIYGSRAANGVIIITTKKGKEGPLRIGGGYRTGIQQIHKRWDLMESTEYAALARQLYDSARITPPTILTTDFDPAVNTDWQEEFLRTGMINDVNLSLSGGSREANYFVSGNYFKNKGTVIDNEFERASIRINSSGQRGRFRLGENLLLSYIHTDPLANDIFTNPFIDMIRMPPVIPVRDPARYASPTNPEGWGIGLANSYVNTLAANVIALQSLQQQDQYNAKVRGNMYLEFTILPGLNYRFNVGLESSFDRFKGFRRPGTIRQGTPSPLATAQENRFNFRSFLFEHTLNYDKTFGESRLSAVVGFVNQTFADEILTGQKTGFVPDANGNYYTNLNQGSDPATTSLTNRWNNVGFLGRVNYTYADKYLLSITFRRDGDSRLGPDNRWGNFPSISGAWRISREGFFDVKWLSDLRLRASYGQLGNTEFLRPWQYLGLINPFPRAVFGPNEIEQLGAITTRLANRDLKWEIKKTFNVGVDAVMLTNNLSFSADFFIAKTQDVLTAIPVPLSAGNAGGDPPVNAASLKNTGFEFSVTYRKPAGAAGFNWDATLNVTTINNKVTGLGDIGSKTYIQSGDARTQIGRAIGEWYVLQTNGIFQSWEQINSYTNRDGDLLQPFSRPGDIIYVDADGDGRIDTDKDRVFAGSPWSDIETGLVFNAGYKNFTLSMQWYAVFGNELYNRPRYAIDRMDENTNFREGAHPWTIENPNTNFPRAAIGSPDLGISYNVLPQSDRWLESGNYLRLRNVEIAYTLNRSILDRWGFTNGRIFISGQNLLTITSYKGLDPDIAGINIFERGLDNGQYPALRIISAGISFGF